MLNLKNKTFTFNHNLTMGAVACGSIISNVEAVALVREGRSGVSRTGPSTPGAGPLQERARPAGGKRVRPGLSHRGRGLHRDRGKASAHVVDHDENVHKYTTATNRVSRRNPAAQAKLAKRGTATLWTHHRQTLGTEKAETHRPTQDTEMQERPVHCVCLAHGEEAVWKGLCLGVWGAGCVRVWGLSYDKSWHLLSLLRGTSHTL